ncbi:hypothetical protein [Xanthomonas translucens]|uniref:hypothetical protein n=1 Tax=Xanthomonas campestris pv. translucens TaxID=343 RepID=UPI00071E75A1|nr:hypothetical protein [Xanthomonas translucens]QEN93615.1 hypothetical protein F0H33_09700 [Xanthomonas translucens pv. undulosa]QSQ58071.1 hypothetical protein ISN37_09130 [Xanthomonas translucens pv. undulosa]
MATRHNYHPHCGCATCGRQEQADERAEALALDLHASGAVLGEAMGELTDDQLALMAGHLAAGNDAGLAEILRRAVADYVQSEIERRTDESGGTRLEAVQRMVEVYEVAPKPAPAMPWRRAA